MKNIKLILTWSYAIIFLGISGCQTTPQFRNITEESYALLPVSKQSTQQTIESITVQDLGEAGKVVQPVRVQACRGNLLLTTTEQYRQDGQVYTRVVPAYENVDPLQGAYVRRLKITNNSEHVLNLGGVAVILVDGAGNDKEGVADHTLMSYIMRKRPCPSTNAFMQSIEVLPVLGKGTRISPGRSKEMLGVFIDVDKRITGDWVMELHDFPVQTNQANVVTRVTSFKFPMVSKGTRTTIKQQKDSILSSWKEIGRSTEVIQ